jgi:VWFA-related protein
VAASVVSSQPAPAQSPPPQQQPIFRTTTELRAIEVRVTDQRHRPITDLTQADFTIFEDGKPQVIKHFAPISLTPGTADEAPLLRAAGPASLMPVSRRVFLIVLGRGNLQVPSKGLDGMIHLVRNRLLPQDLVAVLAWNRATDFTANHEQIASMLERYKQRHQHIESLLRQHFSGLAGIYGNRDMPEWMAQEVDAVLRGPEAPSTRTILPADNSTAPVQQEIRRNIDVLQGTAQLDVFGAARADALGVSLDQYVSDSVQTMQDLNRIYSGLAYLRHLAGEKYMVYVSPSGMNLPSADDDRSVARAAQDAGVVINIFHTGGIGDPWSVASSQNIAQLSGGQYTSLTYGDKFADRIDATTRGGYQLGYYPTDSALDGKYRKITVKVNRRGLEVLYRHGYYARAAAPPIDTRQVQSQSRVLAAARYPDEVRDLQLAVSATRGKKPDGSLEMVVQVNVDPAGVAVTGAGAQRAISLDVAVFCVDQTLRQSYIVGQEWRRVDVKLDDQVYDRFMKMGIGFTVHVPLRRSANRVKAIVYDYAADLVGTAMPKIGK